MNEQNYSPVVAGLLTLGRPEGFEPADWHRSVVNGMTPEHVPELIRVLDDPLLNGEGVDDPQFYAPVHAWRALGHFRAAEAVDALIRCLQVRQRWDDFDEWSLEEISKVLCAVGPAAVGKMTDAIADPATEPHSASVLAEALAKLAVAHPEQREHVLARLIGLGERFADRAKEANDGIVMALLDLKAAEAVPTLRRMFHANAVNSEMVGDWGEVRQELKLERQPDDPPERRPGESLHGPDTPIGKLARQLGLHGQRKSADAPAGPPAPPPKPPPVKHTAKWHRKQARKRKRQTRRC